MITNEEILATVCRVVRENVVDPPAVINADTRFVALEYKGQKQPGKSTAFYLVFEITKALRDRKPYWIWPEYFDFQTTHQEIQCIADACKLARDGYERMEYIQLEREEAKNKEDALKANLKDVELIDHDELLYGEPDWPKVQKFFLEGEFDEEKYLVQAIKLHLRTPEQKAIIDGLDVSIEDMLNGRYNGRQEKQIEAIYQQWNDKLGFRSFGS